MTNEHSEIKIVVTDDPELSFVQNIDTKLVSECSVKMKAETYQLLILNKTTFEIEAAKGNLEVTGDTKLLREFGKSLRNAN